MPKLSDPIKIGQVESKTGVLLLHFWQLGKLLGGVTDPPAGKL